MIHTVIEEQRSAPKDWGKIKISVMASPMNSSKAEKIQKVVEDCLDQLQEAVTGQPPLPLGAPQPDKPVKGQKKMDLGPGGVVKGKQDDKVPAEFETEEPEPGEIAAKGEAFLHPGKDRPVARPAAPEPTGPLGEPARA